MSLSVSHTFSTVPATGDYWPTETSVTSESASFAAAMIEKVAAKLGWDDDKARVSHLLDLAEQPLTPASRQQMADTAANLMREHFAFVDIPVSVLEAHAPEIRERLQAEAAKYGGVDAMRGAIDKESGLSFVEFWIGVVVGLFIIFGLMSASGNLK